MIRKLRIAAAISIGLLVFLINYGCTHRPGHDYQGKWVEGAGDHEFLKLIDEAFESMQPSPQMANIALLYKRDWDGFVEATNWPCWWIQDSCYEAALARSALELILARNERIKMLADKSLNIPDLTPVLPCDQDAVSLNYFEKARFIAGGLSDRLNGFSVWNEHSDPEIIEIARKTLLIK